MPTILTWVCWSRLYSEIYIHKEIHHSKLHKHQNIWFIHEIYFTSNVTRLSFEIIKPFQLEFMFYFMSNQPIMIINPNPFRWLLYKHLIQWHISSLGGPFFQNCRKSFVLTPESLNIYIKWKILEYEALKMVFWPCCHDPKFGF